MRLVFSNLLLYLALGACFKFTDAQVTTVTDAHISSDSTIAEIVNTVPELTTESDLGHPETTPDQQMSTMLEDPTVPLSDETEQTTAEFTPEITTLAELTISSNVPAIVETTVSEQINSDAPSTRQYETTVGFTSELTSPTELPTVEITTAAAEMATDSTALNPTFITFQQPADWAVSPTKLVLTSTITSTATLASPSELSQVTPEGQSESTFDDEPVSTPFTSVIVSGNVKESVHPSQKHLLLIALVCVFIICVLCVVMILFVKRRKKNTSQTFSPMNMNGQSKRSKKKKGTEDDAWAGPVNMEEGLECDAEAEDGLLPDDGKQDGDDMVLSTFAVLDEGDMSNGGVGGEGTTEAKKWEEQEPLLYIDEDVNENKAGKTQAENKTQKGDDKSEEKDLNGGETFCLTTAV